MVDKYIQTKDIPKLEYINFLEKHNTISPVGLQL